MPKGSVCETPERARKIAAIEAKAKAEPKLMRPLGSRVIIRPFEAITASPGGIVLVEAARELPNIATVLAVGPGNDLPDGGHSPMHVAIGDVVHYHKYAGSEIAFNGETLRILDQSDILAVA